MSENILKVLNAWKLVEMLQFKDVPRASSKRYGISTERLIDSSKWLKDNYQNLEIDFKTEVKKKNIKKIKESSYECTLYLGSFIIEDYLEYFREIRNITEKVYNKNNKKSFLISVKINEEKKIDTESLFIPDVSVLLMYPTIKLDEKFGQYKNIVKETILETLTQYEDKVIDEDVFCSLRAEILELFEIENINRFNNRFFKNDYIHEQIVFTGEENQEFNLNSFYLSDIEKIIEKGYDDQVVKTYIEGFTGDCIDINENREDIEKILEPKNIPMAKWPSPVKFKLSLMQSVAVNVVVNEMVKSNELEISSVNGPPGTGKTTLLKDIFANIVVQRAIELSKIKPEDLFEGKQETINKENFLFSNKLNDRVAKFGMVVASSNNGAVENISKELPQKEQISRTKNKDFDEFQNSIEIKYKDLVDELNLFPKMSKKILDLQDFDSWGIFSVPFGRAKNISDVLNSLIFFDPQKENSSQDEGIENIFKELENFKDEAENNYQKVVDEFNELISSIEKKKSELNEFLNILKEKDEIKDKVLSLEINEEEIKNKKIDLDDIKIKETNSLEIISNLPKPSLFKRIFGLISEEEKKYKEEHLNIIKNRHVIEEDIRLLEKKIKSKKESIQKIGNDFNKIESIFKNKNKKFIVSDNHFWRNVNDVSSEYYDIRQQNTPWISDELEALRGELFIAALKIHKYYNAINYRKLKNNISLIYNRKKLDLNILDHRVALMEAWRSIHLVFPVISTTFASLSSMYYGVDDKIIDYLFIDEAGQASPQQAIGGIWRSSKVICVGDPIQIEPVVSLSEAFLNDIKSMYKLEDDNPYLGYTASVQKLSDLASKYGTVKSGDERIGIPLWVHRRCLNPMFEIANNIAYDGKMVLAIKKNGKGEWIDSVGTAEDKYVKENAEKLLNRLEENFKEVQEDKKPPNVYVITPFTNIKAKLVEFLERELIKKGNDATLVKKWVSTSIGTVHTFQGKEADIVYFVCGTDKSSDGAANWSCSKPNLLNVAITRAKKEFYIIGDKQRLKEKKYYKDIFYCLEKFSDDNKLNMT